MPSLVDIEFLQLHRVDDPMKLLLSARNHPEVDMSWVVQQVEGLRQAKAKWPGLSLNPSVWYPPRLNREQASSEQLAEYKLELVRSFSAMGSAADLTGGFGIDSYYLSKAFEHMEYVEYDQELCALAEHNFSVLEAKNILCHQGDSIEWLLRQEHYSLLFIDPARRDDRGRKVAAFEDCTPNLLDNLQLILDHCDRLVVKASPMISIPDAVRQLGGVDEVHVVAFRNECKEVLFVKSQAPLTLTYKVVAVNLESDQPIVEFSLTEELDASQEVSYATSMERYLYEPNAAIMKAGCYGLIAVRYGLRKLGRSTHLYTSDRLEEGFPGRIFEVDGEVKPKELSRLIPEKKAHVVTRNYPMSAADLQKKLRLQEGGERFVIGATLATTPRLFLCNRIR